MTKHCSNIHLQCANVGNSTPCSACVSRGISIECRWDSTPAEQQEGRLYVLTILSLNMHLRALKFRGPNGVSTLASEVDMLKDQIQQLYSIIDQDPYTNPPIGYYTPRQSLLQGASTSTPGNFLENQFLNRYPPTDNADKHYLLGTIRPSPTAQPSSGPLGPYGPSPYANMWPSRIPRMFDPAARENCLYNHVFGILPEQTVAQQLARAYLEGPLHRGWPVSLPAFTHTVFEAHVYLLGHPRAHF